MQLPPRPPALLPGFSLRAHAKKSFLEDEIDLTSARLLAPTDRLRDVDQLRLYVPSQNERNLLHIPESVERLSMHCQQHILLLCGGCAGARFTTIV